jgi:hypothetical protein
MTGDKGICTTYPLFVLAPTRAGRHHLVNFDEIKSRARAHARGLVVQ